MRLATIRTAAGTAAVRVDGDIAVEVVGARDVGDLLADPRWRERAAAGDGSRHATAGLDYTPLIPRPDKIICVGLNYRTHIQEMGRELPEHPTLFAKYRSSLVGALWGLGHTASLLAVGVVVIGLHTAIPPGRWG